MIKKRFISMLVLLAAVATGARAQWTGETYTATATENLGAITVNGDATLTINEGVTVTVTSNNSSTSGINVASGTLTVTGPGTLVVTGAKGTDGGNGEDNGGHGGTGGVAISGNIIVQGGATVTATGGTGGNGGNGGLNSGRGGTGGVAISGKIIVQGGATVTATGGTGGTGGNNTGYYRGGRGGNGGNAFAGRLTYRSGTVTANGGSGGSGGSGYGGRDGSSGDAGNAFVNDVDFTQTTGYSVTNGTSAIGSVLDQIKVVISGGTPIPPSYKVYLKGGTDDATSWQGKAGTGEYQALTLEGVAAGTAVTVKYNGWKLVKSVKAVKKPTLSLTSPAVGQVIGDDGKNYDYASLPSFVTAVAKICYVSGSIGLALALTDEGQMDWDTAISTCAAHTPPFTGGTWKLPSKDEWNNMITAAGGYEALRDGFSSVGGSNLQSGEYWSSTEDGSLRAYYYNGYWWSYFKDAGHRVRACLAF